MKLGMMLFSLLMIPMAGHSASAYEGCSQLERSIGLAPQECGTYNIVELGAIKGKLDHDDRKRIVKPRFTFFFGRN